MNVTIQSIHLSLLDKDWEDRKLGNYLTSETRFEEIIETVCSDSDVIKYFSFIIKIFILLVNKYYN